MSGTDLAPARPRCHSCCAGRGEIGFTQVCPVEATLPMNVDEDQLTRMPGMLARKTGGKTHETVVALRGDLEGSLLPDVLQCLFLTRKTGWLVVSSLPLRGAIYIDRGHVLHAEFDGTWGRAAFFRTCLLGRGHFAFIPTVEAPATSMHDEGIWLLIEAARLSDTTRHEHERPEVLAAAPPPWVSPGEPARDTATGA